MYADARPLFFVTGVVIASLGVWVAFVRLKMREPWSRTQSLAEAPAPPPNVSSDPSPPGSIEEPQLDDKPKND